LLTKISPSISKRKNTMLSGVPSTML